MSDDNYLIVIPARLQSSRLPEKPLVDILGKSMIQRTYEQCLKAVAEEKVFVATDHEKIKTHCTNKGMNVVMTSDKCLTGTDRISEFAKMKDADYYINVQGDEPLINPEDIKKAIEAIQEYPKTIINGYAQILTQEEFESRSIPKLVMDREYNLLYMSRSPIPGNKSASLVKAYRQICIYVFPKDSLNYFGINKVKTQFEEIEDIEILRFVENGLKVKLIEMSGESIAVDLPGDVDKVIEKISNAG
ncbi:3-deoxy-manno-octulosonate cytidylyltransferase [Ekhidna sp.]|uniref:3-deoxy-manno-octulosonate cytidylyltransferase n=1 Tax=Ekhidna sp. TaxID=2608089 RepID=UPI0035143455